MNIINRGVRRRILSVVLTDIVEPVIELINIALATECDFETWLFLSCSTMLIICLVLKLEWIESNFDHQHVLEEKMLM